MAQVKTKSEPEVCTSHSQQKRESLSPIEDEIEKIIEKFQISPSTKNKPLPGSRKKIERFVAFYQTFWIPGRLDMYDTKICKDVAVYKILSLVNCY